MTRVRAAVVTYSTILGIDAEAPLKHRRQVESHRGGNTILGIDAEAPLKHAHLGSRRDEPRPILGIDAEAPLKRHERRTGYGSRPPSSASMPRPR